MISKMGSPYFRFASSDTEGGRSCVVTGSRRDDLRARDRRRALPRFVQIAGARVLWADAAAIACHVYTVRSRSTDGAAAENSGPPFPLGKATAGATPPRLNAIAVRSPAVSRLGS